MSFIGIACMMLVSVCSFVILDIARLYLSEKYTPEEITFNNLDTEVTDAIDKLNTDIDKVVSI